MRADDSTDHAAAIRVAVLEVLLSTPDGHDVAAADLEALTARFPGFEWVVHDELERARAAGRHGSPARRVGGYLLVEPLAMGGQGVVWRARDEQLNRDLALKMLPLAALGSDTAEARFRSEATLAASLDHPGICPVYDAGVEDGLAWIAMRHVDGETLAARLAAREGGSTRRRPRLDDLRLVLALLDALACAHEVGIVHRDVKPDNVVVTASGAPIVLDFGLAKEAAAAGPTRTGDVVGTPGYASPEQLRGDVVDARADVFAVGVILYELVLGRRPFDAPTRARVEQEVLHSEPELAGLPRDVAAVLDTALAKVAGRRYADARAFAADVERLIAGRPVFARRAGPAERAWRWARREPRLAAALGVIVLVAGLAAILSSSARSIAEAAARHATAVALAAEAERVGERRPDVGLPLARAGVTASPMARTLSALASVLDRATAVAAARSDSLVGEDGRLAPDETRFAIRRARGVSVWRVEPLEPVGSWAVPEGATAMTFHATGALLIGGADGVVRRLPPAARDDDELVPFARLGPAAIRSLVVDREHVLCGSADGTLHWLDSAGATVRSSKVPGAPLRVLGALAANRVVALCADGSWRVLDAAGAVERTWPALRFGASDVVSVAGGAAVATVARAPSRAGVLRVDDLENGTTRTVRLFTDPIASLAASADGSRILVCDLRGNLAVVDDAGRGPPRYVAGRDARVRTAVFVEPGGLVAGFDDGAIRSWARLGAGSIDLRGHAHAIDRVVPRTRGGFLSWSGAGELLVHRAVPISDPRLVDRAGSFVVTTADRSRDGRWLAAAGPSGVVVRDLESGETRVENARDVGGGSAANGWLVRIGGRRDEARLAIASTSGRVEIVALPDGRSVVSHASSAAVLAGAWSPSAEFFAVGGVDGRVQFVAADGGAAVARALPSPAVQHVEWSSDDEVVALTANGGLFACSPEREAVRRLAADVTAFAAARVDRDAVVAWVSGSRLIERRAAGERTDPIDAGGVLTAVAIAPDGRVVVGDVDGRVRVRTAEDGWREVGRHSSAVARMCWSDDGERLASAAHDGTIRVLAIRSGTTVLELPPRPPYPRTLSFGPDRSLLVVGGSAGRISIWPTSAAGLLRSSGRVAVVDSASSSLDPWRALLRNAAAAAAAPDRVDADFPSSIAGRDD